MQGVTVYLLVHLIEFAPQEHLRTVEQQDVVVFVSVSAGVQLVVSFVLVDLVRIQKLLLDRLDSDPSRSVDAFVELYSGRRINLIASAAIRQQPR